MKKAVLLIAVLFATVLSGSALAHGRVHFGVYIGGPVFGYGYYPYYAPYYPPVVATPYYPPVYIQQAPAPAQAAPAPAQVYWYYCADSGAYYPYVKECPQGWMKVVPTEPQPPH